MSKHTPGPWSTTKTFGGQILVHTEANFVVAIVRGYKHPYKSNARLIAAAPELLDALQLLIDMDVAYQRGPKVGEAVEYARAAIAKATGEDK